MKLIVLLSLIFVFAQTSLATVHYHYHMQKNSKSHKNIYQRISDCHRSCGAGHDDCINHCLNNIFQNGGSN